ncbi:MAG: hypothetical protein K8T20_05490 [Planctomycetes bacterium]|nr:hypothetical protein [Planctomycetota bacterium]
MAAPPSPHGARSVALRVLRESERTAEFAADILEKELEDDRVSALDRSLATALVYATTRHRGTLDKVLGAFSHTPVEKMDEEMRHVLRLAASQLLFLEKVPAYAILNEAAEQAKLLPNRGAASFTAGVLRALQRAIVRIEPDTPPVEIEPAPLEEKRWTRKILEALEARWPDLIPERLLPVPGGRRVIFSRDIFPEPAHDPTGYLSAILSHPVWLIQRWLGRFGAAATLGALEAGNRHPELAVRVNAKKCTSAELVDRLRKEKVEVDAERMCVSHTGPLWKLAAFQEGWFSIQDEAAQRVVPLLDVKPGELVADLCAAPGGKAAQLAEQGARVVAMDSERGKVKGMGKSFERLGLTADLLVGDAKRPPLKRVFDAVLVDVPCSNTGVLARRVEARWRVRERDIRALVPVQRRILLAALSLVKPGGRVLYSTCSLEEEENGALVREVIREGNGLRLEKELRIVPSAKWTCGGYAARIGVMRKA